MTVTAINQYNNQTTYPHPIRVANPDVSLDLSASDHRGTDIWIKWCNNASDFANLQYVQISYFEFDQWNQPLWTPAFAIWQSGNNVFYCRAPLAFSNYADSVPGDAAIGGN